MCDPSSSSPPPPPVLLLLVVLPAAAFFRYSRRCYLRLFAAVCARRARLPLPGLTLCRLSPRMMTRSVALGLIEDKAFAPLPPGSGVGWWRRDSGGGEGGGAGGILLLITYVTQDTTPPFADFGSLVFQQQGRVLMPKYVEFDFFHQNQLPFARTCIGRHWHLPVLEWRNGVLTMAPGGAVFCVIYIRYFVGTHRCFGKQVGLVSGQCGGGGSPVNRTRCHPPPRRMSLVPKGFV